MTTVTGITAARAQQIEDGLIHEAIVDPDGFLQLVTKGGEVKNAGYVLSDISDLQRDVQEAREKAIAASVLRIDSTKGSVFKNNSISTDLNVTIYYATYVITDITVLQEVMGAGAYLEWFWRREDDEAFGVISSSDARISRGGFTLTVSPNDVDEKTIFQCVLHA